jgi:hypothetical protein
MVISSQSPIANTLGRFGENPTDKTLDDLSIGFLNLWIGILIDSSPSKFQI